MSRDFSWAVSSLLKSDAGSGLGGIFAATREALVTHTQSSLKEFWTAFPTRPVRMIDAVIGFVSGLAGVFLAAPFNTAEKILLDWLKREKFANKLIRVDNAITIPFAALREIFLLITFSGNSSLWSIIASSVALWIYHTIKRVKLLRALIKSKTPGEFVDVILDAWRRKFRLLRILGVILGILSLALWIALFLVYYGMIFTAPTWLGYVLAQDSKQVSVRVKGRFLKRFNFAPGYDQP